VTRTATPYREAVASTPLSSVDYAWLRMDDPTNLMLINGVLVTAGRVDPARLRAIAERRLLPIPRFHQKVVAPKRGGRPRWEEDPDFDLDRHLVTLELPAPGGDRELRAVLEGLVSLPLDRDRPLWQFHLIAGYEGGSVLFARIHHCVGDGVALMLVLLSLADLAPDPAALAAPTPNPFTALLCRTPLALSAVREIAEQVMPDGMRLLLQPAAARRATRWWLRSLAAGAALGRLVLRPHDPRTPFKGPLGIAKCVAWSSAIPLADVRAVGSALGATVNDVLLAAMSGGLRRYLEERGHPVPGLNFRAAMPVNLRPLERMADLGNEFGLVFLSLPVGMVDVVERLAELRRRALALKRSAEPVVVLAILRALGVVARPLQKLVVRVFAAKTTAVMTNVPGPREVLYLAGRPIRDVFFWVPQAGRVGLGISICSYAGRVRLGVGTDAGLVPDPEEIVAGFDREFAEMQRRAHFESAASSATV
jgi:diacylglycerol O-acyltransferase / wax synthase